MHVTDELSWKRPARRGPTAHQAVVVAAILSLATVVAGCGQVDPPAYRLNMQEYYQFLQPEERTASAFRGQVDAEAQPEPGTPEWRATSLATISTALWAVFGTPDEPYLLNEVRRSEETPDGLDFEKILLASGPTRISPSGRQRGLYRQHCVHCHGISGDGAGPTALFLNPYPRDYRKGVYKFKSTETNDRPSRADLVKILHDGVPGTAMPSFALLPPDEVDALVEYVKYLTVRGVVELNMAISLIYNEEPLVEETGDALPGALRGKLVEMITEELTAWKDAEDKVIAPPPPPWGIGPDQRTDEERLASMTAGRALFVSKEAQCLQCHGPTALGDGGEKRYDVWNEFKVKSPADGATWLLPVQELIPRNLHLGNYRGGRRPVDIYRRIHAGIAGGPMPASGPSPGKTAVFQPEQIWQMVDYVLSIPYEETSGLAAADPANIDLQQAPVDAQQPGGAEPAGQEAQEEGRRAAQVPRTDADGATLDRATGG